MQSMTNSMPGFPTPYLYSTVYAGEVVPIVVSFPLLPYCSSVALLCRVSKLMPNPLFLLSYHLCRVGSSKLKPISLPTLFIYAGYT